MSYERTPELRQRMSEMRRGRRHGGDYERTPEIRARVSSSRKGKGAGAVNPRFKHGLTGSPAWRSWQAMKQRCLDPNSANYRHYGGRGIGICGRWLGEEGFVNFLADMGPRPEGMTLGRINPDGDYEPGNVEWVTVAENTAEKNRRPAAALLRREALRAAMRAAPTKTNKEFAAELGVGNSTVIAVRRELEQDGEIPPTVAKPGRGNSERVALWRS